VGRTQHRCSHCAHTHIHANTFLHIGIIRGTQDANISPHIDMIRGTQDANTFPHIGIIRGTQDANSAGIAPACTRAQTHAGVQIHLGWTQGQAHLPRTRHMYCSRIALSAGVHLYTHIHTGQNTHTYIQAYTHTYIQAKTHTYIQAYTHT